MKAEFLNVWPRRGKQHHRGNRMAWTHRTAYAFLFFCTLGMALPTATDITSIHAGYSALWFDPERNGEGFVLEVLPEGRGALLYWYTYDEQGNPRWLQDVGQIVRGESGDIIKFSELKAPRGGEFGPNFNPEDVQKPVVGEAILSFQDCDQGTFSYTAFEQSQTIDIQRLTHTMAAVGCWPYNGVPGKPVKAYAGQSGSWFDTSHDGEGFSLQWLSRDQAIVTWYTYDSQGNPYWMIGVGNLVDGKIVFSSLDAPRGARFGAAFDPDDVEHRDWGSLTLTLNCNGGTAHYESNLPGFGSGDFELTRLTRLKRPDCPYTKPKLTDLYEVTWTELPIPKGDPLLAESIADDGTIAGLRAPDGSSANLILWRPEEAKWTILTRELDHVSVLISADGNKVIAAEERGRKRIPLLWRENGGWKELSGLIFDYSSVLGASDDLSHIVGIGNDIGDSVSQPWIWDAEHGQRRLPLNEDVPSGLPRDVSNDGKVTAGGSIFGTIWTEGEGPRLLYDHQGVVLGRAFSCDRDCGTVFGSFEPFYGNPSRDEAWFWTAAGEFGYLGTLDDAINNSLNKYSPWAATANGSMVVGGYTATYNGFPVQRAFIWTQRTGIVSVRSLVAELGIGDDNWDNMFAFSVSSNGDQILLLGQFPGSSPINPDYRGVVLGLAPKEEQFKELN